jgi:hypothetical protein
MTRHVWRCKIRTCSAGLTTRTRSQNLKSGAPLHHHNTMEKLINSKGFHVVITTTEKKTTQTRTLCSGCSGSFVRQHEANNYSAGTAAHSPHNDGYVAILLIIFLIIMVVLGHYMKHWYVVVRLTFLRLQFYQSRHRRPFCQEGCGHQQQQPSIAAEWQTRHERRCTTDLDSQGPL